MQYNRILVLLDALESRTLTQLPKGVGLKTLIEAREHGLIELEGDIRKAECVLTMKGLELQRKIRLRAVDGHESGSMSSSSQTKNGGR